MIRVASPALIGNEKQYLLDCIDKNQLTMGTYVHKFEEKFAEFIGTKYAVATCNGTCALHLILLALGINERDDVIVSNLTYVATANAVTYCGARPVFVDVDDNWCLDPSDFKKKMTLRTKAVIPVHLYGHPANMDEIGEVARARDLYVVEDAAESLGSSYRGNKTGSIGAASMFSLFGNKIITSGEGGVITTDSKELYDSMIILRGQGVDPQRRYWHTKVGYNYRMTDIQAAVGLAQLECIEAHIEKRREIFTSYSEKLKDISNIIIQPQAEDVDFIRWMVAVTISGSINRDEVARQLLEADIETRPTFPVMTWLPIYRDKRAFVKAEYVSRYGLCLPTHGLLKEEDIEYVCQHLKRIVK